MFEEFLKSFIGQNIAVICARFVYRGKLEKIGPEVIELSNAKAVEETGSATALKVKMEDSIPKNVFISTQAIELVYFPNWVDSK